MLDPSVEDFKPSALRFLDRVDALVMPGAARALGREDAAWAGVSAQLVARKPKFYFEAPAYCTAELAAFVRERLGQTSAVERVA